MKSTGFDLQPRLEDDLLLLRPLMEKDFEELYTVASDPLVWEQHPAKERSERKVFEAFFEEAMASGGAFAVIDKKTGKIIGSSRFQFVKEAERAIEIGWTFLARQYWGGHYNKAMKTLMMNHAYRFVDNILFYIDEQNIRSQKAVEKIGGHRITVLDGVVLEKRPNAAVIYLIAKRSWQEKLSKMAHSRQHK